MKITHFVAQGKGTLAMTATGSAIVNLAWVAEVQPDHGGHLVVRLKDDARTQLPVARDRARAFKERLVL